MSVIPCHRSGHLCNWPVCPQDCDGRPGADAYSAALDQWDEKARPFGYAYRYPEPFGGTVIRYTGGEEINGSKPIEVIPLYDTAALRAAYDKGVEAGRSNEWGDDLRSIASRIRALAAIRTPPPEVVEAMARAMHEGPWQDDDDRDWLKYTETDRQAWRNVALAAWQAGIDRGME